MPELLMALALLGGPPGPGEPPAVRLLEVGTVPATVRTGDAFLLRIRFSLPEASAGSWVLEPPDTLPVQGGLEARGPGRWGGSQEEEGGADRTLEYPLQALRPGHLPLPPLNLRLRPGAGVGEGEDPQPRWVTVSLGSVQVHPHLPPPGEAVQTAPPLPSPPAPWKTLGGTVLLCLGGAAAFAIAWLLARRGTSEEAGKGKPRPLPRKAPPDPARELEALREILTRLKGESPPAGGVREAVGTLVSGIRKVVEGEAGVELEGLTTPELLALAGNGWGREDLSLLEVILKEGDRLRFGEGEDPDRLRPYLGRVEGWVEGSHG